jgi:hypothetical protein
MRKTIMVAGAIAAAAVPAASSAGTKSAKLGFRAATLTQVDATTWNGKIISKEMGAGQLTLTGPVTFHDDGTETTGVLHFRATFKKGWVRGCIHNTIVLRPGNRQVWDGPGQITTTSKSLRRFSGVKGHDGGVSRTDDLTHAKPFSFGVPGFPEDQAADTSC